MTVTPKPADPAAPRIQGLAVGPRVALPTPAPPAFQAEIAALRRRVADLLTRRERESEHPWTAEHRLRMATHLIGHLLGEQAEAAINAGHAPRDPATDHALTRAVLDALLGLGRLQPMLDDPDIENIDVIGHDRVFVTYSGGRRVRVAPVADSDDELLTLVRAIAAQAGEAGGEERRLDRASPQLSLQLPGGARLFAVIGLSHRPALSIRRHRHTSVDLADLVGLGTIDRRLEAVLAAAVRARRNILVSGGMGSGKTTLLRALASRIDAAERLVTIEDVYELGLHHDERIHPDVVALQARDPNLEGRGEVTAADLVRWALRMQASRVIVGEVRGQEVLPMLLAMAQGSDGSMSTIHASASEQVPIKLAAYAGLPPRAVTPDAVGRLLAVGVHLIVHLETTPDGRRVVSSVREIVGLHSDQAGLVSTNEIFRPGPDLRARPHIPPSPELAARLVAAGCDPAWLTTLDGPVTTTTPLIAEGQASPGNMTPRGRTHGRDGR